MQTIEITDAAASMLKKDVSKGKVVRMFLAAIDSTGATYGLAPDEPQEADIIFESNGVSIHMHPQDAEFLAETVIDYIDDPDLGTGYIIRGPMDDMGCGCDHGHDEDEAGHHSGCSGCH